MLEEVVNGEFYVKLFFNGTQDGDGFKGVATSIKVVYIFTIDGNL